MGIEIERKFLVKGEFKNLANCNKKIIQGYISTIPERTVRVRIIEDKAYLTIKGIGNKSGTSRYEWEKEISVKDASDLLKICEPEIIDKVRYLVEVKHHMFEVDEFLRENKGLIIAEVELEDEDEIFNLPDWIGNEVTGELKYYNASLAKKPFNKW